MCSTIQFDESIRTAHKLRCHLKGDGVSMVILGRSGDFEKVRSLTAPSSGTSESVVRFLRSLRANGRPTGHA